MLTRKKAVLRVKTEAAQDINYEAIEFVTSKTEVEDVWRRNKTPIVVMGESREIERSYPVIDVPKYVFGSENFIAFCHRQSIECGEYVSDQKYDTSKDSCLFCDIANHMGVLGPTYLFNQTTQEVNDMIIYESKNFFVKVEYGSLKRGMLMICPKIHVMSAAQIPDEQMDEYKQVMMDVEFLLKAVYGDEPVIFFEHGASPSGITSHARSIVHAHTHVAWGCKFDQKYLDMVCVQPVKDIKSLKDSKYFSYQEGTEGKLLAVNDPKVYVQRQYPRQVIAFMMGISSEKANWRKEPFMETMIETFNDLYKYLVANSKFLSERIVKATEGFVKGYPMRDKTE